jgi:hypothetical protein
MLNVGCSAIGESITDYVLKSKNYEASHYEIFSSLLTLHLSMAQIFTLPPFSDIFNLQICNSQRVRDRIPDQSKTT